MKEKNTPKKKGSGYLLKGCLITVGSVIVFGVIFIIFLANILNDGNDLEEDMRREKAAINLKNEIERYYNQYNIYPASKVIYSIKDDQIREYLNSRVIRYRRDPTGEEWFILAYTESGKLGWNGKQYSNKPEVLNLPIGVTPYKNGFYILDLH